MRVFKQGKSEVKEAVIIAALLVVIQMVKDFIAGYLNPVLSFIEVREVIDLINAVVVGFIVATVLMLVRQSRYAAIAFALALGVEIARIVESKLPEVM